MAPAEKKPAKDPKLRYTCFTLNNWTQDEYDAIYAYEQISFGVIGKENAPTTGTPHLQGYIEFKQQVLLSTLHNIVPRLAVKFRIGNGEQAADYCRKSDPDYFEWGDIHTPGYRTDLDGPREMIEEKAPMRSIARAYPNHYILHHKGLEALADILVEPRYEEPTVTVICGYTGTGKTKLAYEMCPDQNDTYSWTPGQLKWFDGYCGHTNLILDEYRGDLPFGQLLNMLDRWPCRVERKGGMCQMVATNIVITSPLHPTEWYKNLSESDSVDQLLRRITTITTLTTDYQ